MNDSQYKKYSLRRLEYIVKYLHL